MPYETQEIPAETRCLNKHCNHMYAIHDADDGACDFCSCHEFKEPYHLKPKWVRDPDTDVFRWICSRCSHKLFGRHHQVGMTSRDLQTCVKCHNVVTCSMVNKELIVYDD